MPQAVNPGHFVAVDKCTIPLDFTARAMAKTRFNTYTNMNPGPWCGDGCK
jgi:hypothetical protein